MMKRDHFFRKDQDGQGKWFFRSGQSLWAFGLIGEGELIWTFLYGVPSVKNNLMKKLCKSREYMLINISCLFLFIWICKTMC